MGTYKSIPMIIEAARWDDPDIDEILTAILPAGVTVRKATLGASQPQYVIREAGYPLRTIGPAEPGQWITVGMSGIVTTMSDRAFESSYAPIAIDKASAIG
jgi:hypothetical protein